MSDTLVVNLLGGPGCGKSSIRAGLFHDLKFKGIECEEATEYAKDLVWSKSQYTLTNQIHVFGEQHHRIWRLLDQVEVIITDSPLLLTAIYDPEKRLTLKQLVMEEFNSMKNFNVLLQREKKYNPKGRNQTEAEAKEIDGIIKTFLDNNFIPYIQISGNGECKQVLLQHILRKLIDGKQITTNI